MLPRLVAAAITGFVRILTGAQALWVGCAPEPRQRVYFANHQSHGDFVLLWATLPRTLRRVARPVAGADYWLKSPVRRFLIDRVFHGVLVDRTRESRSADPLEVMLEALDAGDSLIIFPEGTRNTGTTLLPFKSGLWHLARRRPDVELVPVYIENIGRVLPKGHFLPVPLLCSVRYGAPVAPHEGEDKAAFLARARDAVVALGKA